VISENMSVWRGTSKGRPTTCIDNGNPLLLNPMHCASAGPPVTLNGVVSDARFQNSIVRQVPDELALEMTLVENIQREDLNAIEAARAFERLMDEFQLTQESVAERTGKDRATVANAIRLLKLEDTIQEWIEEGRLTAGHGRALLGVAEPALRMRYAKRAARGGLTVRQIERLGSRRTRSAKAAAETAADPNIREALDELQRHLGTKVHLREKTRIRPGQLVLEFYDQAQLMGIYDRLMK